MNDQYQNTINTFHQLAKRWQDSFMHLDLYNDTYDAFCKRCAKEDATIFEIGCGPGNITQYLLKQRPDYRIYATDAAPAMIELAKQNVPSAKFDVLDCRAISQIDETFDAVVCGFCLPYLMKTDAQQLLQNTWNLLTENGVLYLSTIEEDYNKSTVQLSSDGMHSAAMFFYLESDLLEMLAKSNFVVEQTFRKHLKKSDNSIEAGIILICRKANG